MNYVFDAHCHWGKTALPCGVDGVITNATHFTEWDSIIRVQNSNSGIFGAIGIHPWNINNVPDGWMGVMEQNLMDNPDLMVGEIGLDKNKPDINTQIQIFIQQMHIANKMKRGVHIHCVKMWDTMRQILSEHNFSDIPFMLFHRFSGAIGDIGWLVKKYNAYFSYRGIDSANKIQSVPMNRLLVESDSDAPAKCIQWVKDIAQICGTDANTFYNNAKRMIQNG